MAATRAWHAFAADVGGWDLLGFGSWAIEEKATGAFAGQLSLNKPPHFPEREIGWFLLAGFEGRGYATEAALAARAFAYGTLGWPTAVSYVDPDNARSIALARRHRLHRGPRGPAALPLGHRVPPPRARRRCQ